MDSKFSDIVIYFDNLARKHKDIRHSDTKKHFFRMEIDEVLAGINRTDVVFPLLILEGYSYNFTDNKSDNLLKNRHGAFVLLDLVSDPTDFDAIHAVWDHMEEIGDELIVKINSDKRNPLTPAVRDFQFSDSEAVLIAHEIARTYGIRYRYTITSPRSNDVDPTKWLPDDV